MPIPIVNSSSNPIALGLPLPKHEPAVTLTNADSPPLAGLKKSSTKVAKHLLQKKLTDWY